MLRQEKAVRLDCGAKNATVSQGVRLYEMRRLSVFHVLDRANPQTANDRRRCRIRSEAKPADQRSTMLQLCSVADGPILRRGREGLSVNVPPCMRDDRKVPLVISHEQGEYTMASKTKHTDSGVYGALMHNTI